MQSTSRAKPMTSGASGTADRMPDSEPRAATSNWLTPILGSVLVAIIGVVTVVIQSHLQQRATAKEQKAQEERVAVEKKEAYCHRVAALLVEIDALLKKTSDQSELAQWSRSKWDGLDDKLASLRILYLEAPSTSDQSIAAKLKDYSEFVGDKWRGPAFKKSTETARRKIYQESRHYISEAEAAVIRYRSGKAL